MNAMKLLIGTWAYQRRDGVILAIVGVITMDKNLYITERRGLSMDNPEVSIKFLLLKINK